jgi:hypothetical protein
VTGWFEYYLRCDASYEPWVYGAQVQADLSAGRITLDVAPNPPAALPCLPPPLPPEVANLRVRRVGTDLELSWDPAVATPAVTGYRVYRSATASFAGAVLSGSTAGTAFTELISSSPSPAFFKVAAVNANGEGPR